MLGLSLHWLQLWHYHPARHPRSLQCLSKLTSDDWHIEIALDCWFIWSGTYSSRNSAFSWWLYCIRSYVSLNWRISHHVDEEWWLRLQRCFQDWFAKCMITGMFHIKMAFLLESYKFQKLPGANACGNGGKKLCAFYGSNRSAAVS